MIGCETENEVARSTTRIQHRRPNATHTNSNPSRTTIEQIAVDEERIEDKFQLSESIGKGFIVLYLFRIFNALMVTTWFDPDETWQSVEVAHNMVFGNGYLSWEWKKGIRGAAHPLIFALVFYVLDLLGLSDTKLIVIKPLIAVFSSAYNPGIFRSLDRFICFSFGIQIIWHRYCKIHCIN
jgi:hypothetical protein